MAYWHIVHIGTLSLSLPLMKHSLYILLLLIISASALHAQRRPGGDRKGFSLRKPIQSQSEVPDSLLIPDSAAISNRRITAYRLTPLLGDPYIAPLDTHKLNFANSTLVESESLASATWPIQGHRHKPASFPNVRNHGISCLPTLTIIISRTLRTHSTTTRKSLIQT